MKNKTFIGLVILSIVFFFSTGTYAGRSLIGKEDFHMWDGVSGDTTFTRTSSGGYTLTLHDITWMGVDVLHEYGASVNQNSTTLQAALTAVGTSHNVAFWMAPGTWTITSGVTIPSNVALIMPFGAVLSGSGVTLTINGPFEAGPYQTFSGTMVIAGNPIIKETIPDWWGAKGDNSTNDHDALDAAFTHWLQRTYPGTFKFISGKNYLCNSALAYTITSNVEGAMVIDGYGAKLTSGLSGGTLFTLTADALVRYVTIQGLTIVGSASEEGLIKLDGDDLSGATNAIYEINLTDLNLKGFGGTGLYLTNDIFEVSLMNVRADAHSTNKTGYGMHFDNGTYGGISSIDLVNCQTRYGLYGVYAESPVGDVNIYGGTFITAQEYGVYLANAYSSVVIGAHFENNWESAGSLAAGNAGLYVINSANIIGCYGTTNRYQRYVVRVYASSRTNSTQIIGGLGLGDTAFYANITGVTESHCNIIGGALYYQPNDNCTVSRSGFIYKDMTSVNTSGTGRDDLKSYTIQANTMGLSGGLKILAAGTKSLTGGTKALRFYFGSSGVTVLNPYNNTLDWRFEAELFNSGTTTSAQRMSWAFFDGSLHESGATVMQGYDTFSVDTTSDVDIKMTGQCADSGDTIYQTMFIVEQK